MLDTNLLTTNDESTRSQLLSILRVAVPSMMTFIFGTLSELINTYFIGRHLDDPRMLAGAGMGNILISMMCLAVFQGMNGALETLISQAIGASCSSSNSGGSNSTKNLAIVYLNRGRIIIFLAFIPIIAVLLNIDSVLVSLGQDQQTSKYARDYIVGQIPGLLVQAQFDCTMRYLSAYKKSHIPMCTQIASTALHIVWCHVFIVRWELGISGASLAICVTYTTNFIALVLYTLFIDTKERRIWTMNRQAFQDWMGYLKLGIPGTLMIMMDMWCYEIITLQSGYLVIEATAAQIILSNIQVFCNQIPLGISIAASTLVGGAIGENNTFKAKKYLKLILAFSLTLLVTLQIIIQLQRENIAAFFSEDEVVQHYVLHTLNWASMCILMDGFVTVMIGIIKGIGKQANATFAYLVCFYLISVPASFYFCFRLAIGLRGLWIGLTTGLIVLTAALALIIRKADWFRIAHQAKEKFLKESLIYRSSTALMMEEFDSSKKIYYSSERSSSVDSGKRASLNDEEKGCKKYRL